MKLYTEENNYKLYEGDMLELESVIEPNSIDAIITDPPYELGFMGKSWDSSGISFQKETWEKCYNVLKPGGHMLVFGGSKTIHRIACAIEDAGFEIRDTIMWMYGSGMPKSLNLGKSIESLLTNGGASPKHQRITSMGDKYVPTGQFDYTKGMMFRSKDEDYIENDGNIELTHEESKQWEGWGTCLKPSYEPIIIARKPCEINTTQNVLKYGVGGINIDECRVPISQEDIDMINAKASKNPTDNYNNKEYQKYGNYNQNIATPANINGRFPSNVILTYDETDEQEVCSGFPYTKSTGGTGESSKNGTFRNIYNGGWGKKSCTHLGGLGDDGSAARYFYCAKANQKDREEGLHISELEKLNKKISDTSSEEEKRKNIHPTVKPCELIQYLIRLVTPPNGIVLDPFNGSGSTGKACMWENKERDVNYKYIGIELTPDYLPIAKARIDYVNKAQSITQLTTKQQTGKGTLLKFANERKTE